MNPWFIKVGVDSDGDTYIKFFNTFLFVFYKAHQGRMPIFTIIW